MRNFTIEGSLRKILRTIGNSLRRMFRAMARLGRYGVGFLDGFMTSLLDGGGDGAPDEVVVEDVQDAPTQTAAPEAVRRFNLAQLAKTALIRLDGGRPVADLFELKNPKQVAVQTWVMSLDDSGRRALRHCTMPALGEHLRIGGRRAVGLPAFPISTSALANSNAAAKVVPARSFRHIDIEDLGCRAQI